LQHEGDEPQGLVILLAGLCLLGPKKSSNTFTHPSEYLTVLAELQKGNSFGGRVLLPKLSKEEKVGYFSVIAYSGIVDTIILTA